MYIESATDLSSRRDRGRNIHTKRPSNSYGGAGQNRTQAGWPRSGFTHGVTDTDWIYGCLPASSFNLSVFLVLFVFLLLSLSPTPVRWSYSIALTIAYFDGTSTPSLHNRTFFPL